MNETVSIIVPVYKVEKYLDRCIESIVAQTYPNLEIILVDDGSPDNCPQICDDWAAKDSRIKVIHKENAGLGMARNTGIESATGSYLMFVDSDDWISEKMAETMLYRLHEDGTDMAVCHVNYAYDDGTIQGARMTEWMTDSVVDSGELLNFQAGKNWSVSAWNKMYRKEVFKNIRYPELKCGEDLWVYPKLVENCEKVSLVSEPLIYYYQRVDSIVHCMTDERKKDELTATLNMIRALCKHSDEKSLYIWYKRAVQQAFHITSSSKIGFSMLITGIPQLVLNRLWKVSEQKVKMKLIVMKIPFLFRVYHCVKSRLR